MGSKQILCSRRVIRHVHCWPVRGQICIDDLSKEQIPFIWCLDGAKRIRDRLNNRLSEG